MIEEKLKYFKSIELHNIIIEKESKKEDQLKQDDKNKNSSSNF